MSIIEEVQKQKESRDLAQSYISNLSDIELAEHLEANVAIYCENCVSFAMPDLQAEAARRLRKAAKYPLHTSDRETAEENYNNFWKEYVEKDGVLDLEAVQNELSDFSFILEQIGKVYMHVTGGLLSKPMYHAETVISEADDYMDRHIENLIGYGDLDNIFEERRQLKGLDVEEFARIYNDELPFKWADMPEIGKQVSINAMRAALWKLQSGVHFKLNKEEGK